MAQMIDLNLRPDARILRQFGWIALVGFGLLALAAWHGALLFRLLGPDARGAVALGLAAVGAVSALFSLVFPRANWPLYAGLTLVAFPIGFVLSYVIMATLFYVVIAPIGLVMRAFGHDPMDRRFLREARTYWVDARPQRPRQSYFRQF